MIRAADWRPLERNTLQSFVTLALPSGLILQERSYHRTSSGAECIGLPIRPQRNRTGRRLKDYETGNADAHADFPFAGGAVVIRFAERSFRPLPADVIRSPPHEHRALPPEEF